MRSRTPGAVVRTVVALILREMSTRYGRKPGGYVWAVLEPLGMIMILALAFSFLLRTPALGNSFILFYATGFLPFNYFQSTTRTVARSMRSSKALLAYPVVHWIDAVVARLILNTLTALLVAYILIIGILTLTDAQAVIDMTPILIAYCGMACLGLGVGLMNCVLTGFFPIWETAWSIITRPLFLASGVIVLYDRLPIAAQNILWFNPLIHLTGEMRSGFYSMYRADYVSLAYVFGVALFLITLGMLLMRRFHKDILER